MYMLGRHPCTLESVHNHPVQTISETISNTNTTIDADTASDISDPTAPSKPKFEVNEWARVWGRLKAFNDRRTCHPPSGEQDAYLLPLAGGDVCAPVLYTRRSELV